MGTTMDNPGCEWVRACLPLWVGLDEDPTERNGEGDDLSPEDRRAVEGHLGVCPPCRQHRDDLERARKVLADAAGSWLVAPDAPSLWPSLEARLQAHDARTRRPWWRAVDRVADGGLRALADLDGERPLRSAWMRDSLGEILEDSGLSRRGIPREPSGRGRTDPAQPGRGPAWMMGAGVAAAVLALVIGLPAIRRQHAEAQSIILANAEPLAVASPTSVAAEEPQPQPQPQPLALADDRGIPSRELAQADPIPVPQPAPASGRDAAAPSRTAPPSRWNFDLEHGIPMPPDAREAKPVY